MCRRLWISIAVSGVLWFFGCGTGPAPPAQYDQEALVTLERIFSPGEFSVQSFGPARWLAAGQGYTTLEPSESMPDARDIVRYHPESGERQLLVKAESLIPPGQDRPLRIADYIWSRDAEKLLIFTNTRRVWRQNTRGDYWVLDLANRKLQQLGRAFEPSTLMFAKFSPTASQVGYVMQNNIYVEDLATRRIAQLTRDGSENIINGTFDWVYEEEFGLRDGFRWSPDGKHIAYWQLDSIEVREFHMINNTDSLYPRIITFKYPKVGETNSRCRVGVVSARGGNTLWFNLPGDSRDFYLARMDWAASSREIVLQRLNRLQNTNWVMLGNIFTGRTRSVFTDKDEAWVEVVDDLYWLEQDKYFTWMSERDGWNHAFRISRDGTDIICLTPGDYDVVRILRLDEENGWLYFIACPEMPTERHLYRVPLDGSGSLERLTPENQPGSHGYQVSQDGQWAIHTYSTFDSPAVTELIRLPGHETLRVLADNAELRSKITALARQPVEFFRVDIGEGVPLDAWCMKPPDFDPQKKYPLLLYVYGEPAGSTVQDRWGGRNFLWHTLLTQKGYLVMSIDNRGTNVPRGREWRKCIYRQIGILASADQAAALKTILAERSYVDPSRIGIWGWSGGGQMSLNAIFRYPELYSTAMAVAFVANQLYYDTIYQERYMGLPGDNEAGYRDGSPITHAHRLKGNLLIVHGTADDNVHYQSFEALTNELIKHNQAFTMMSYPNRTHGIREGENTSRHLFELLTRFLMEKMPPGPVR
ncbi:MAG: S9 family peptidase [Candidatus Aminicenantaceae bacterium]